MKILLTLAAIAFFAGGTILISSARAMDNGEDLMTQQPKGYPIATLAGGCFWCTESEYRALDGVLYTRVGYMGGKTKSPTYQQISTGTTGHAEIVEVTYDPEKISYADLLRFFLTKAHNPTQLNRQGVDVGTQYRSAIFYHDAAQKDTAMQAIKDAEASGQYDAPIVTAIEPASTFWPAEDYHQQYYEKYEEQNGRKHLRVILKKQGKLK